MGESCADALADYIRFPRAPAVEYRVVRVTWVPVDVMTPVVEVSHG